MKIILVILALGVAIAWFASRRARGQGATVPAGERETVGVDVEEIAPLAPGHRRFRLAYAEADGAPAVELSFEFAPAPIPDDAPAVVVNGTITRVSSADPRGFLRALAAMHGIAVPAGEATASPELPIEVAYFGDTLHLGPGDQLVAGFFTPDTAGAWIVTKLFLPVASRTTREVEAQGRSELFLALNPTEGFGVFYVKADEYADGVVRAFAALLAG